MIVGSGLIAQAFAGQTEPKLSGACLYAAGVSNSSCQDPREFERERERLLLAMRRSAPDQLFIYFSTCSIDDPEAQSSPYVRHKATMEQLVRERTRYLIFRLPQLAGFTPNPHTLLNYLFSRIVRSERFQLWSGAHRNIIDVDDIVKIVVDLIASEEPACETINIANTRSSSMFEIVRTMEGVLERRAIFDTIDRGTCYAINTYRIRSSLKRAGVLFSDNYLGEVIQKYYSHHA